MELLRESIEADRLAVPLGVWHPEVPLDVLLGRGALLLADDHDGTSLQLRDPADDRGVVAETAIAMQLLEAIEHARDHVDRVRPLDVARRLDGIPCARSRFQLRRVEDEVRVVGEMPVALDAAPGPGEPFEHQRPQRTSCDAVRNALRKNATRSFSCARETI